MSKKLPLRDAVAQRVKEAERKQIGYKAGVVAHHLGSVRDLDDHRGTTGTEAEFNGDGLSIAHSFGEISGSDGSMGFYGTSIEFEGKTVYNKGGGAIHTYIPGPWERVLERLHRKACLAAAKNRRAERQSERKKVRTQERAERAKWGL